MALGDVHTPPMTRRGARYRYPGSRGTCVHMMHAGCMACSLPSGPAAVARRCAWLPAATSDNPTRGEDTELAARPRMARRNGPIWPVWTRGIAHTIGIDAVAGPGRIVNPSARMEKPRRRRAPASRRHHASASRVRAGPCAPRRAGPGCELSARPRRHRGTTGPCRPARRPVGAVPREIRN